MANCKNWKTHTPQALVSSVCGRNRAECAANFAGGNTLDGCCEIVLPIGVIYRDIAELSHSQLWVTRGFKCRLPPGWTADVVVRSFFEPIPHVTGFQQRWVTNGRLNNDKANGDGMCRLQCAAVA